jgi:hypothetical protein
MNMEKDRPGNSQPAADTPSSLLNSVSALTDAELDELRPPVLRTLVQRQIDRAENDGDEALMWTDHTDWSDFSQSLW